MEIFLTMLSHVFKPRVLVMLAVLVALKIYIHKCKKKKTR
jgi:hypothetical protein